MEQPKIIIKNIIVSDIEYMDYMDACKIDFIKSHIDVPLNICSIWWGKSGKIQHITIYNGSDIITLFPNKIEYVILADDE